MRGGEMTKARMPRDIFRFMQSNCPDYLARALAGDDEGIYTVCQALAEYTKPEDGERLQPFETLRQVFPGVYNGLVVQNPNARVYVGDGAKVTNVSIRGTKPCVVFIGSDAEVMNLTIDGKSEMTIVAIGFSSRLDSSLIQTLGKLSLAIFCPGTTAHKRLNIHLQEDSYVILGADCMLSVDVSIRTSDSHGLYDMATRQRVNGGAPVIIHKHCWISRSVSINKGVEVLGGTLIGQGAIVNGKLEGNAVYSGFPVQKVRSNVFWDRRMGTSLPDGYDHGASHFLPSYLRNILDRFECENESVSSSIYRGGITNLATIVGGGGFLHF